MPTFTKTLLSGSTNGASTLIAATSSPGTTIHTAQSGTSGLDEVWLYADNSSTSAVKLTVEFGGTAEKDQIELNIPGESGLVLVVPGLVLNNSLVVRAFAATTNVVSISGYVNRIS
jgi:hypothetical protein